MNPMNPIWSLQVPRAVIAPPTREEDEGPVTVRDLGTLLAEAGVSWGAFLGEISRLDLADAGNLLRYLDTAVFKGSATPQALQFHLQFIKAVPPGDYPRWEEAVRTILGDHPLSEQAATFLNSEGIDLLWRRMLNAVRQNKIADPERRPDPRLLVQSLFRFLELADSLISDDPNIAVVLDAVNQFGGLQQYFSRHQVPRATVKKLLGAGYDANYLVFGRQEVRSRRAPRSAAHQFDWIADFNKLITKIVGTEQSPSEIELGVDRFKFLSELKDDRELMVTEHSLVAAGRLAARLIPLLKAKKAALERLRLLVPAARLAEYVHTIERYKRLTSTVDPTQPPAPERLVARRSAKFVPELFFDDSRLGSWLFKPEGIVHGEICRVLLDPAVPLLEIWLEPYTEFMAVVPLYPGFNASRQRCILIETYHFDDRISDLLGPEETMRFLLDSLLVDAYLAQAEKLAIFAAPWGRSAIFADYVAGLAEPNEAIRYFESYGFESIDADNDALQNSLTGQFHYTESLGYNRPLSGTIDFGYNLVGYGTIDKLTTGGRGVFEIDIHAFLDTSRLLDTIPAKEEGVAYEPDTPAPSGLVILKKKPTRPRKKSAPGRGGV